MFILVMAAGVHSCGILRRLEWQWGVVSYGYFPVSLCFLVSLLCFPPQNHRNLTLEKQARSHVGVPVGMPPAHPTARSCLATLCLTPCSHAFHAFFPGCSNTWRWGAPHWLNASNQCAPRHTAIR